MTSSSSHKVASNAAQRQIFQQIFAATTRAHSALQHHDHELTEFQRQIEAHMHDDDDYEDYDYKQEIAIANAIQHVKDHKRRNQEILASLQLKRGRLFSRIFQLKLAANSADSALKSTDEGAAREEDDLTNESNEREISNSNNLRAGSGSTLFSPHTVAPIAFSVGVASSPKDNNDKARGRGQRRRSDKHLSGSRNGLGVVSGSFLFDGASLANLTLADKGPCVSTSGEVEEAEVSTLEEGTASVPT